jgi:hypothetical protein
VRGDRAFKRILDRLPDVVRQQIVGQMKVTGTQILSQQRARAPMRTGAVKAALSMRVLSKTMKLKVGLLGKPINRKLFYAHIVQYGRKAKTVLVERGSASLAVGGPVRGRKGRALRAGVKGVYKLHVRAMKGRNFIFPMRRDQIYQHFRDIWQRALVKASYGVSDD